MMFASFILVQLAKLVKPSCTTMRPRFPIQTHILSYMTVHASSFDKFLHNMSIDTKSLVFEEVCALYLSWFLV